VSRLAGRYELVQRLAEGGMAEVWLAAAHGGAGFTRRVAVKQLFPREQDGGAFERMFLDEARITSRLHHAGIVGILDYGVEDGRAFQVLELVDGFDAARLAQWGRAQGKPLPVGLALHVCAEVGHALHFAHVATDDAGAPLNIVHRDVSPQNVLLSRAGEVKLSDFGIAFAEGRTEKTVGGVARGKPAYMAPEQAVRGPMDGRTDVFALGCVLHALVTGESALRDENALVDLLAGLELTLGTLPVEVKAVVAQATRRNKAERYETAEAMALACARLVPQFLEGEPRKALADWVLSVAPAREVAVVTPTPKLAPRRSRVPVVLGAGALSVVAAGAWWLSAQAPTPVVKEVDAGVGVVVKEVEPVDAGPVVLAPPVVDAGVRVKPVVEVKPRVAGRGVLSVGGERLLRGEVIIDGTSRGFAPGRFELTAGAHRVEVRLPSGERVGPREWVVSVQHTASAPLTWEE
jgi:serine/threonine-protein kinase